jgi:hypothetical protein
MWGLVPSVVNKGDGEDWPNGRYSIAENDCEISLVMRPRKGKYLHYSAFFLVLLLQTGGHECILGKFYIQII